MGVVMQPIQIAHTLSRGPDAMMIHPVDELSEDQLVRHRCDTSKAIANPRLASLDRNEPIDIPIIQA